METQRFGVREQPARSQNPPPRFAQQGNTVSSLPSFYCARQWNIHLMCLVERLPFALSGQRWSYSGVAGACSFWRRTCAFWRSQRRSLHLRGNPFRRHHPITCRQISSWFVTSVRVPIQPACPSAFFCLPFSVLCTSNLTVQKPIYIFYLYLYLISLII